MCVTIFAGSLNLWEWRLLFDLLAWRERVVSLPDGRERRTRVDYDEESMSSDDGFVQQIPQRTADGSDRQRQSL